jgi:hypothetical protein
MGDRILRRQRLMVGGKVVGTFNSVTTATNPTQVPKRHLTAVESIAVDLGDGVLLGRHRQRRGHRDRLHDHAERLMRLEPTTRTRKEPSWP